MSVADDFRAQVARDKTCPLIGEREAAEGIYQQAIEAEAAEALANPRAYIEWLNAAAMAYRRAEKLSEKDPKLMGDWGQRDG